MKTHRFAALDLARFFAAMVVFLGHLLFLPQSFTWSPQVSEFLSPIRVGDTAVLFFYALSGYVLNIGINNHNYYTWVKKRIFRLYPVYISAWFFGFLLILFHDRNLLNIKVLLLGVLGAQSFDPKVSLVINGPLWSLSVEIIFSFILFFLLRLRNVPWVLFVLIPLELILWNQNPDSPLLRAFPYFTLGVLLRSNIFFKRATSGNARGLTILSFLYFVFFGARQILELPFTVAGEVAKVFIIGLTLFAVSRVEINGKLAEISVRLGRRSFCIYAFHFPVLLISNYFIQPGNIGGFIAYATLSILGTAFISEFAFRFIDSPSLARSRRN